LIAADASSVIAYLSGEDGEDVSAIENAFAGNELLLPPPVVTEVLSRPIAAQPSAYVLATVPLLAIEPGFWQRAGLARQAVLAKGCKAAFADALIAQCCIDAGVALITRDRDFRHFAQWCGLKLAV
jgi:predicted nucleic acid-binding protein